MIYKVDDLLGKLENCIKYKIPFSHIRFGDGGIKFIDSILKANFEQMRMIIEKEGLPSTRVVEIFELWGYYARQADFIDSPEVYFDGSFWPRVKKKIKPISEATKMKMLEWETLYNDSEFLIQTVSWTLCTFVCKHQIGIYLVSRKCFFDYVFLKCYIWSMSILTGKLVKSNVI